MYSIHLHVFPLMSLWKEPQDFIFCTFPVVTLTFTFPSCSLCSASSLPFPPSIDTCVFPILFKELLLHLSFILFVCCPILLALPRKTQACSPLHYQELPTEPPRHSFPSPFFTMFIAPLHFLLVFTPHTGCLHHLRSLFFSPLFLFCMTERKGKLHATNDNIKSNEIFIRIDKKERKNRICSF